MLHPEMGLWERIGRSGRAVLLLGVGLAGGATALAVASVPDSSGVVHGCYSVATTGTTTTPATTGTNLLRIIDPSAGQTCATTSSLAGVPGTERTVDWNTQGPAGQQGQSGPTGPSGTPGTPGTKGSPGPTTTIAAGHTFTISGGQVITVGGATGVTIAQPPISTRGAIGEVFIGTGKSALTFNIVALGLTNPDTTSQSGSGGGAGKVSVHDISITKKVDKASPTLFLYCANGKHFPKVTVQLRKAGKVYLRYNLTNAQISSYQSGGHGNGGVPVESLSLSFSKIQIQ
jgi:type VI secretion system Hcp family effector